MARMTRGGLKMRKTRKTPARVEMLDSNDVLTDEREREIAASFRDEYDTWLR